MKHWAVITKNSNHYQSLISRILAQEHVAGFESLQHKKGISFSKNTLNEYLHREDVHDIRFITNGLLAKKSSGEQKRILFRLLRNKEFDYLILDNPYDAIDVAYQSYLQEELKQISQYKELIIFSSRIHDVPEFCSQFGYTGANGIEWFTSLISLKRVVNATQLSFPEFHLPHKTHIDFNIDPLITFKNVSVSYEDQHVLSEISWTIRPKEFWHVIGPNGSGKTTLLSLITGDNPKGYGQDIALFGMQKGNGETIWDIKKHIGYVTPSMTHKFNGHHTVEHMLISGLVDAIGLYSIPTSAQKQTAAIWLKNIGMSAKRAITFSDLTQGEQRLVLVARAMIKQPKLLILDEPTMALDDNSALHLTHLIQEISERTTTCILYVSHRKEANITPTAVLNLFPSETGSKATVTYL